MTLTGNLLIGQRAVPGSRDAIRAIDPATNQALEPAYAGGPAGQFCTNPGLVIARQGPALQRFIDAASAQVAASGLPQQGPNQCQAQLFVTPAEAFLADPALQAEVFGAASLVVACTNDEQVHQVAEHLEGQLTATLQLDDADIASARALLPSALRHGNPLQLRRLFDGQREG